MFFVGMTCVVHRLVCGGEVAEDPARGLPCLHFSSSSSIPEPFPRWTDGTTVQLTQLMFVPVSASSICTSFHWSDPRDPNNLHLALGANFCCSNLQGVVCYYACDWVCKRTVL